MTYNTYIAANTCKGFFSYFDELIRDTEMENVYLIKGGPGCGKSTLMKKVANHFEKENYTVERIYCSSDPGSLDGVKICELSTVIIDATAPHSYDMKYPGIIDNIIDISKFWDRQKLLQNKNNIKTLFDDISQKYKTAYSSLRAAGTLYCQQLIESEGFCDRQKVAAFIKKYIKQNAFTPVGNDGKINNRFLSAISCNGTGAQNETIKSMCERGIIIEDEISLSSYIISRFISYFKKSGFDVTVFHNPLCPEYKIDHIIVPKLKLGVFTQNSIFNIDIDGEGFKKINSKSFIDKAYILENKNKIALRKKITSQLLSSVTDQLAAIKALHDKLEQYYINSIDYALLDEYTNKIIGELCKIKN